MTERTLTAAANVLLAAVAGAAGWLIFLCYLAGDWLVAMVAAAGLVLLAWAKPR